MTFMTLNRKTCKYAQVHWIDPKTKKEKHGDKIPMLFVDQFMINNKDILKLYQITIREF